MKNECDYSVYILYVEWGEKDHLRGNGKSKHSALPQQLMNTIQDNNHPPLSLTKQGGKKSN